MRAIVYTDDLGATWEVTDIPEEMQGIADEYREKLLEAVADQDEELMVMYLEGEEIEADQIRAAIRQATLANEMTPVFVGSAFKNKGVQPLLDGVVDYLPIPLAVPPVEGKTMDGEPVTREADENAPLSALAFKVQSDPHVGKLTYMRVYSGTLKAGSYVMNTTKGRRERVGRLLQLHANSGVRDRKLPTLRTYAEKYIKLMPDLVRADGLGWAYGKAAGAYGQMHCISLVLQGMRDGWIPEDQKPKYFDILRRLFYFFFQTYLDQEHGFLDIRDTLACVELAMLNPADRGELGGRGILRQRRWPPRCSDTQIWECALPRHRSGALQ